MIIQNNSKGGAYIKKYEYVNVKIGRFIGAKSEEHRQIIDEYASKGYRYVCYIPTSIREHGAVNAFVLRKTKRRHVRL